MVNKDVCVRNINNLKSYDRINVTSELLRTSSMMELEFYLNVINGILKFHKQSLAAERTEVNNNMLFPNFTSPESIDSNVRLKLITSLTLLNESNYVGAEKIYEFLKINYEKFKELIKNNPKACEDVILIYQLANEHPAFSLDHCQDIYDYLTEIRSIESSRSYKEKSLVGNVNIDDIDVLEITVDSSNNYVYKMKVKWNSQELCIRRTLEDIYKFYTKVYQMFQSDICSFKLSFIDSTDLSKRLISDFFRQFLKSPSYVIRCDYVRKFLEPWSSDLTDPCTECRSCLSFYSVSDTITELEDGDASSIGGPYPPDSISNVSYYLHDDVTSSDGADETNTTTTTTTTNTNNSSSSMNNNNNNSQFDTVSSVTPNTNTSVLIITPDPVNVSSQPLHRGASTGSMANTVSNTIHNSPFNTASPGTVTNSNTTAKKTKKIRLVHSSGSSPIRTPSEDSSGHNSGSDWQKTGVAAGCKDASSVTMTAVTSGCTGSGTSSAKMTSVNHINRDDNYYTRRQFSLDSVTKFPNVYKHDTANRTENWLCQSTNTITQNDSLTPLNQSQSSTPSSQFHHSFTSLCNKATVKSSSSSSSSFQSSCGREKSNKAASVSESQIPVSAPEDRDADEEDEVEKSRSKISSTNSSNCSSGPGGVSPAIVSVSEESIMAQYNDCFIYNLHQWLRELRLHKYHHRLQGIKFGELRSIKDTNGLVEKGLTKGAAKKLISYLCSLAPSNIKDGPFSHTFNNKSELYVSLHAPDTTCNGSSAASSSSSGENNDVRLCDTSAYPCLGPHDSQNHCLAPTQKQTAPLITINRWKSQNHQIFVQQLRKSNKSSPIITAAAVNNPRNKPLK